MLACHATENKETIFLCKKQLLYISVKNKTVSFYGNRFF
ncbi:Uncharacterized protein dnm_089980 [Desulfonema magnum]|uniref:Uncharacterized protein n=1 Tax=Desulfonema magnum TaxID=45655 RepID=A0A975BXB5_9BACT|nr:Uncharacterized protein dnm_089980 [Desulfonema magnum]